jgi:membrane-associated phospholipid phosphatase
MNKCFAASLLLATALGSLRGQDVPPEQSPPPTPTVPVPALAPGSLESRSADWKSVLPNIIEDQPKIYGFPVQLAHGRHWAPTLAFLALTAGFIASDPYTAPYFRNTTAFHGFNKAFSSTNTSLMIAGAPISILATGLIRNDHYERSTALLAGEALADVEILDEVLKLSTRRARPIGIAPGMNFSDNWWESGEDSFPSGHTIAAFAVATVISRRYPHQKWVPWVAYGLATAIAFSRVTLSAHYVGDVFVGAALGYFVSRFAVLRQ